MVAVVARRLDRSGDLVGVSLARQSPRELLGFVEGQIADNDFGVGARQTVAALPSFVEGLGKHLPLEQLLRR